MTHTKMQTTTMLSLLLTLGAQTAFAECRTDELRLDWPMGGEDAYDWVINNYVDLDATDGLKDYTGNTGAMARTYNGHNGVDIDLANFRTMDEGRVAMAAADGVVTSVQGDLFDRNMEGAPGCGAWNHVYVRHANGFVTMYGHLRQNSIMVNVGDIVVRGQVLGLIGSSGCSSTAHLHFEVHDCRNGVVDPFLEGMWTNPPVYNTLFHVMDMTVRKGGFPDPAVYRPADALLKDPPPDILSIPGSSRLGIGLSVAGGGSGDKLDVVVKRPNGDVYQQFDPLTYSQAGRHSWPRWWVNVPAATAANDGYWTVEVRANDRLARIHSFRLAPTNDAIFQGLAEATYQHTFQSMADAGYQAVWVDGSAQPGQGARMSAVYRKQDGAFRTYHNVDGPTYQQLFNQALAAGLQLNSIDNYISDGQLKIAAVFSARWSPGWQAYHLVSAEDHQTRFNNLRNAGYRPYAISVVVHNGRHYISAAYTNTPSSGWLARYGLSAAEYQTLFNQQTAMGRAPIYVDAYDDNGTPRFSAIWAATANVGPWSARHNLAPAEFAEYSEQMAQNRMNARSITSYLENGRRYYAAIWSN